MIVLLTLLLATAPEFGSTDDLQQWLTYYYLRPRPELTIPSLALLDEQIERATGGSLADQSDRGGLRTFYAQVFAHNDAVVAALGRGLPKLPPHQQPFVREALRRCGTPACARALNEPRAPRASAVPPDSVDDLWAAFAATGDERYVREVIARVAAGKTPRLSLRSNAYQHSRVLAICETVMAESAGAKRSLLDDIIGFARAEREERPSAEPK
jgi:hypothetical protein